MCKKKKKKKGGGEEARRKNKHVVKGNDKEKKRYSKNTILYTRLPNEHECTTAMDAKRTHTGEDTHTHIRTSARRAHRESACPLLLPHTLSPIARRGPIVFICRLRSSPTPQHRLHRLYVTHSATSLSAEERLGVGSHSKYASPSRLSPAHARSGFKQRAH